MIGLLSMIPSGIKMALIGVLAAAVGLAFWHYRSVIYERDILLGNVEKLELALEVEKAATISAIEAVKAWKMSAEQIKNTLNQLAEVQKEANQHSRKLNDVLFKHDLNALSLAKPGLIERRINRGTADIFKLFERETTGNILKPDTDRTTRPKTVDTKSATN